MNDRVQERMFEELYRKCYVRFYHYAFDFVEEEEVAKDIVNELFGDFWKRYDVFSSSLSNPEAYLNRALRNRCINYLKHKVVERNAVQRYIEKKKESIDVDAFAHEERMMCVERMMEKLAPRTRFILEQCYVEGKKYNELADDLGISAGMVHKHISKAMAFFRNHLGDFKRE